MTVKVKTYKYMIQGNDLTKTFQQSKFKKIKRIQYGKFVNEDTNEVVSIKRMEI